MLHEHCLEKSWHKYNNDKMAVAFTEHPSHVGLCISPFKTHVLINLLIAPPHLTKNKAHKGQLSSNAMQ